MPDTQITQPVTDSLLTDAVTRARDALTRRQHADGHWVFELEADATIPAEYVLLEHFLDRIDDALEQKIGVYLRSIQGEHGGWPLFHDGAFDLSASVKAYYALKAIGDSPDAPHMVPRAGGDPGGRRGGADQRVHPRPAGAVRPGAVARGAGDAAGDHAPAAVVPVPPVQGVVLVAHGDRAAAGADGAAPACPQPARRAGAGAVPHPADQITRLDPRPVPLRLGALLQGRRRRAARRPSRVFPKRSRDRAIRKAVAFVTTG